MEPPFALRTRDTGCLRAPRLSDSLVTTLPGLPRQSNWEFIVVNQTLPERVSVAVIGAGPVGLAVAAQLGEMGIEVAVLERNVASMGIPRAIVLDDEGTRVLQAARVSDRLMPLVVEGDGPLFYDNDGSVMVRVGVGTREYGFSKRFFIHQPDLEEVLKQRLNECSFVSLHFGTEVVALEQRGEDMLVKISIDGRQHALSAEVVLACDGARSPTREQLGIKMVGNTYDDDWLVIDTLNDPDQSRSSKAFCYLQRPYMSIPAPHGGRRYEFKLLPGESRDAMVTPESVQKLVGPIRRLEQRDILRATVYTFQARIAERLSKGRVLLLGDAAHLTPPFAGQGMNAGLRDTANVAWKVAMVVRKQAPPALLGSYELERRGPIWSMIQLAVTMGEIIMPRSKQDAELRSSLFAKLDEFPGGREFLMGMKFKPQPRYEDGVFVDLAALNVPGSLVGAMIPQPTVTVNGHPQKLDDVIGPKFALLVQSAAAEKFVTDNPGALWPELRPAVLSFAPEVCPGSAAVKTKVLDPAVAFPLLAHRDQIVLIRPDRYAAVAFWPTQTAAVVTQFRAKLNGSP